MVWVLFLWYCKGAGNHCKSRVSRFECPVIRMNTVVYGTSNLEPRIMSSGRPPQLKSTSVIQLLLKHYDFTEVLGSSLRQLPSCIMTQTSTFRGKGMLIRVNLCSRF